jgi:hypothetical protein
MKRSVVLKWEGWTLPTKISVVGAAVTILGTLLSCLFYFFPFDGARRVQADPHQIDLTSQQYTVVVEGSREIELTNGWNLIASSVLNETDIEQAFAPIMKDLVSIFIFHNGKWEHYVPENSFSLNITKIPPGSGLWVRVKRNTKLTLREVIKNGP